MSARASGISTRANATLQLPSVSIGELIGGSWRTKTAPWPIVTPFDKLRAKYSRGGSLLFSLYTAGSPISHASAISDVDLFAVSTLMNGRIGDDAWRALLEPGLHRRLDRLLRGIPPDAALEDGPVHDGLVKKLVSELTKLHGIRLANATKILAIKRPGLVPMMDRTLQECFGTIEGSERNAAWTRTCVDTILTRMRQFIVTPRIRTALDRLRAALKAEFHVRVSRVRILDELIWFDWNIDPQTMKVRGFPEWAFDPQREEAGVHLLRGR